MIAENRNGSAKKDDAYQERISSRRLMRSCAYGCIYY